MGSNFFPVDAQGVQDAQHTHAHVGKHAGPQLHMTRDGEDHHKDLYGDGENDVFRGNAAGAAGNADAGGDLAGLVAHDDNVRRFNGGVGTQAAHGDADIRRGQHRRVVDAVSGVEQAALAGQLAPQAVQLLQLILGQELAGGLVQADLPGDLLHHRLAVAGKHGGLLDTQGAESRDGRFRFGASRSRTTPW